MNRGTSRDREENKEGSPMNRGTSRDKEENKEGSPRNKGTSKDREENKNERSRRPRDSRNFSTSSDQIGKGHETMKKKSQHRRSSSMGVESQRQTKENWTDQDYIRQRNGPVTR